MNGPGIPVEIGRIDQELGKLWEGTGDKKTRASLINLVIYSEDPDSMRDNTELLATMASQHAFRAILILADPKAQTSSASAWISAHCHLAGKGEICSEQITFRLDGEAATALPSVVFSHLDSDLPLCFWTQVEFREPLDEQLWLWVDRLIYDSLAWEHPARQFALAKRIAACADSGTELCDLNWSRLHNWRIALANLFDHSVALRCLEKISLLRVACGAGARTTALLLAGWLASQLGWKLETLLSENFFQARAGHRIEFEIATSGEGGLVSVELSGAGFSFRLARDPVSGFLAAELRAAGMPDLRLALGSSQERDADILLAELGRSGRHPLYPKAVAAIEPLLGGLE